MIRKIVKALAFSTLLVLSFTTVSFAQESVPDTKKEHKTEHIVGVQMNELIRQVFNFNSSTGNSANNNPYLLIYTLKFKKCGIGIRTGVGYTYQDFTTEDGLSNKLTQINELHCRLGIEKSFQLSSKWSSGVGIDGIANLNKNYTSSILRSFDTVSTKTKSELSSFGGGAMAWLRYSISPRILIGTETSFYYATGEQKQKIEITQRDRNIFPFDIKTSITTDNSTSSVGTFSVPVTFYLIVKF
jgi:hypothetical protein